jgi:hypothetical protein
VAFTALVGAACLANASTNIQPQPHPVPLAALFLAAVSSCVHGLLGGVVDHRGTDAWDLADDTKLLQRLYALNVLRLEGHEPDVQLWTVRGHNSTPSCTANSGFVGVGGLCCVI